MKRFLILLAAVVWGSTLAAGALAQPILNRVEKLLRDQVDAASTSPPAAEPGYLGLVAEDTPAGVRVLEIVPGQAADRAGLKKGDSITNINGQAIRVLDDMAQALRGKPAGAKLSITAARDGAQQQRTATLGRRAPEPAAPPKSATPETANKGTLPAPGQPAVPANAAPRPRLGVRSVPVNEAVRQQNNLPDTRGAHVVSVIVDSAAERAEIPLGAIITAVGQTPIGTPQELAAAIAAAKPGEVELSYVYRGQPARKKVELEPTVAAAASPNTQVRARPTLPADPGPSDPADAELPPSEPSTPPDLAKEIPPPVVENPSLEQDSRIEALERHVKQLEARIKTLEAELAAEKTPEPAEPN